LIRLSCNLKQLITKTQMSKTASGAWRPAERLLAPLTGVATAAALLFVPAQAQVPTGPATPLVAPAAPAAPGASTFAPRQAANQAPSGPPLTLKDAVQQAVLTNPEVLARWHGIKVAESERDAARGGLLPRLDLNAVSGIERRSDTGSTYSRRLGGLTLNQLLYDGFATYGEFQRLDFTTRARVFEFFDTSESVALEAARAYLDVVRYRELVFLAEDNYVDHRAVFSQIDRRVRARVARGVDLEQVSGRLALAEANLLNETASLHDSTARFLRIVGLMPPAEMPMPALLADGLPDGAAQALAQAQARNPALLAAIQNVRVSQAALDTRDGAFRPRFDLRLRREYNRNQQGLPADYRTDGAEVVLSWNLFNGLSDRARNRQFAEQMNLAKDVRDKTCRDISQTLIIAYRDIRKLTEQLEYLVQQQASIGKALIAYRQQFDIGQRTLLDLLDTENELFQAKRAVVNTRQDLHLAHARTHAGQGNLLGALQLRKLDSGPEEETAQWAAASEPAHNCPAEPVPVYTPDKASLVRRAAEVARQVPVLNARERALAESSAPAPGGAAETGGAGAVVPPASGSRSAPAGAAAPAIAPSARTPSAGTGPQASASAGSTTPVAAPSALPPNTEGLREAIDAWRRNWAAGNVNEYLAAYAPDFTPAAGMDRSSWESARRSVMGRSTGTRVEIENLRIEMIRDDRASAVFTQRYSSAQYRDTVVKTLQWRRINGAWRIVQESAVSAER
jgi:adhesin transport system outer membrane protein